METCIFKDIIAVFRAEQQRRGKLRREAQLIVEYTSFEYDQWLFIDAPFVNELCLMLLVTLRHQVDREEIKLAALAAHDGKDISPEEYHEEVQKLKIEKKGKKTKYWNFTTIRARLKLESCTGDASMKTLRALANLYKHEPSMEPNKELLELLKLKKEDNYQSLPESHALQEGLAVSICLGKDADYCDIAERFVDIAKAYLADAESHIKKSPVKRGPTPFNPDIAAR